MAYESNIKSVCHKQLGQAPHGQATRYIFSVNHKNPTYLQLRKCHSHRKFKKECTFVYSYLYLPYYGSHILIFEKDSVHIFQHILGAQPSLVYTDVLQHKSLMSSSTIVGLVSHICFH